MPGSPAELAALAPVEAAMARLRAHPLSRRKTLLAAVLLDNLCDELFDTTRSGAEDVLGHRSRLRAASSSLGLVFDLCAGRADGPRLEIRTVSVPIEDYPALAVEDFMVSLYNGNTVQRVVIATADGEGRVALEVLGDALRDLRVTLGR